MLNVGTSCRLLGKTPHCKDTLDPEWTNDDQVGFFTDQDALCVFDIPIDEVEERQREVIEILRGMRRRPKEITDELCMFRYVRFSQVFMIENTRERTNE